MKYDAFLRSEEWKKLRLAALKGADGRCEYCGEPAEHVHHIRYPKVGQPHTLDMLVAVCARCHDISHGAKEMKAITGASTTTITGPFEDSVTLYHADGLIWATVEQWSRVLRAPYFMPDFLRRHARSQLIHLKAGTFIATCGGETVYRWPPIAASLDLWDRAWRDKKERGEVPTMETNKRAEAMRFELMIAKLKAWGYELQERELQAAMRTKMTQSQAGSGLADVGTAMQAIQTLAQATETVLVKHESDISNHEVRIKKVEDVVPEFRDPDTYVTVKHRCLERSLSFAMIVEGRMNLSQACGMFLKKLGAPSGTTIKERQDGSSLTMDVATWRRADIDKAVDHYIPSMEGQPIDRSNGDPGNLTLDFG